MTPQETKYYLDAMNIIKHRERLESMDATQYPHLQDRERTKRHRAISKLAYPDNFKEKVLKTTDLELI